LSQISDASDTEDSDNSEDNEPLDNLGGDSLAEESILGAYLPESGMQMLIHMKTSIRATKMLCSFV
jgi:hypothetical protein